jgi:hypothetical protein
MFSSLSLIGHDGTLELLQRPRQKGILEDVAELQSYDEIGFSGKRPKKPKALQKLDAMAIEMTEKTTYRATTDTLPNFTLNEKPSNILELKGVLLDRLQKVGCVLPSSIINSTSPITEFTHFTALTLTLISWHKLLNDNFYLFN